MMWSLERPGVRRRVLGKASKPTEIGRERHLKCKKNSSRSISSSWKEDPPFAHWKSYSSEIRNYRQGRIDHSKRSADPRRLKEWFQSELSSLRANPFQREKNAKIGLAIMPYFYEHGAGWKAATKLNTWRVSPGTSVESFFADWAAAAREEEAVLQAILRELI